MAVKCKSNLFLDLMCTYPKILIHIFLKVKTSLLFSFMQDAFD